MLNLIALKQTERNNGLKYGLDVADSDPISTYISVDDDLPCNHEELLDGNITCPVFGRDKNGKYYVTLMVKFDKWYFILGDITHWMLIPELPKE